MAETPTTPAPPTPAAMVAAITTALAASPGAVVEVNVGGHVTKWDRAKALAERDYWLREQTRTAQPRRKQLRGVDLSGGTL